MGNSTATEIKTTKDEGWNVQPSSLSDVPENPMRKYTEHLVAPPDMKKSIIHLTVGDPTVYGNLNCPEIVVDEVITQLKTYKHNGYFQSSGKPEARQAVAKHFNTPESPLTEDDVIITTGCLGAIDISLTGLMNPGDNILLPNPGFPAYQSTCDAHRFNYKLYDLLPEKEWTADIEQMKSLIDEKTRAILIINPSNPCGSVFPKEHLLEIVKVAEEARIPIITDEIYQDIVFESNVFHPISSVSENVPVITLGGIAKSFIVPGWRLGWIIVHDRHNILAELKKAYKSHPRILCSSNSVIQSSLPRILAPEAGSEDEKTIQSFLKNFSDTIEQQAMFCMKAINETPGLHTLRPQGSLFMMAEIDPTEFKDIKDGVDFAIQLFAEEGVSVLPGAAFGLDNFFRIMTAPPMHLLEEAFTRISEFCARHHK